MGSKHYNHSEFYKGIEEKIDISVRNMEISLYWYLLKEYTEKPYKERLSIVMQEYHLGSKAIELLISKGKDD